MISMKAGAELVCPHCKQVLIHNNADGKTGAIDFTGHIGKPWLCEKTGKSFDAEDLWRKALA